MPLHINLYHEVQRQELARQRDPLRLGMLGMLVIAVGFVLNYFILLGTVHSISLRYAALKAQYAAIEPKSTAAKARQVELDDQISASDNIMKEIDGRFYWAPVLDQVLQSVPRSVQLTHVYGAVPSVATDPNFLSISGISSAAEPRKEAEAVRTALDAKLATHFKSVTSTFKQLDDADQVAVLDGHRYPTALFTIEIQIQASDPVTVSAPAPSPAPTTLRRSRLASAQ